MVRRIFKPVIFCLIALITQAPVASALSDAQRSLFIQGINYFDANAPSCGAGSAVVTGTTTVAASLSEITKKYDLQSAIIQQVGGKVIDSYQSDQPPSTPASTMKLIIADTALRSGLDLGKSVAVGSDVYYAGKSDLSPAGNTVTLLTALEQMLNRSSNTAANVLMKAMGGVDGFSQKAHSFGYTHTTVKGYYDPSNDGKNTSTIGDQVEAMNHLFSTPGSGYDIVKKALESAAKNDNVYDIPDDANKWAGTSTVAGNIGKFNIAGQDYIIGLYKNANWNDAAVKAAIKNASADITNLVAAQASGPNRANTTVNTAQTANTDYAGRSILNQGELKALADNSSTYQEAASQVGIAWQVLAALHYRETGFSLVAPGNGQGAYQIVNSDKHTPGAYPPAGTTLTQAQFLAQSLDAANFVKNDGAGLNASPDVATIKEALVRYNGLPQKYIDQAVALGHTSSEGYEGSPYVMNIADPPRDPSNGPISTWLQDRGGGNYQPATADQYGAFVVFASIAGMSINGSTCTSSGVNCNANATQNLSPTRQSVVCIAQAELTKWTSGTLKPGDDYKIYSQGAAENWCADFASWVFNQAGYPLKDGSAWRVSAVDTIKSMGEENQKFHWHAKSGYIPKPGDMAVHNDGKTNYHLNIVVGVSGNKVTLIGGNQGSNDLNKSLVSRGSMQDDIIGYVTPD